MNQTLTATIPIPDDMVIIKKIEYQKLLDSVSSQLVWSMKDLEKALGRSDDWIKEKILYPYREELDVQLGGFVRYPITKGQPWKIGAKQMRNWIEENLEKVI